MEMDQQNIRAKSPYILLFMSIFLIDVFIEIKIMPIINSRHTYSGFSLLSVSSFLYFISCPISIRMLPIIAVSKCHGNWGALIKHNKLTMQRPHRHIRICAGFFLKARRK